MIFNRYIKSIKIHSWLRQSKASHSFYLLVYSLFRGSLYYQHSILHYFVIILIFGIVCLVSFHFISLWVRTHLISFSWAFIFFSFLFIQLLISLSFLITLLFSFLIPLLSLISFFWLIPTSALFSCELILISMLWPFWPPLISKLLTFWLLLTFIFSVFLLLLFLLFFEQHLLHVAFLLLSDFSAPPIFWIF